MTETENGLNDHQDIKTLFIESPGQRHQRFGDFVQNQVSKVFSPQVVSHWKISLIFMRALSVLSFYVVSCLVFLMMSNVSYYPEYC